ncbi:MAG: hypothetical protein SFU53_07310 [Terrimicrobiaceae bacterium]|nr:hypothetical protein [Terrimicrobiaceae bacterium]
MSHLVVGLSTQFEAVRRAVRALRFQNLESITVFSEDGARRGVSAIDGIQMVDHPGPGGVGSGAIRGGAVGGLASVATIGIPFIGAFIFVLTLPIATAVGAAIGSAIGAGAKPLEPDDQTVEVALRRFGIRDTEIPRLEKAVHAGHFLLAVRCPTEAVARHVENIMDSIGTEPALSDPA